MRIKSNVHELKAGEPGKAVLVCDSPEDVWHLYNLICKGDFIKTITFRKVAHESGGIKSSSIKKKIDITIKVEEVEYDQKEGILRFKGKNVSENDYISIGQYQAIEIAKGLMFTLFKKSWDEMHLERLQQATDPAITSDLAAIVMEEGVAHLYLISSHLTILKAKIEQSIPKKRKGPSNHDKALHNFFQKILDAIAKNINFDIIKCIIVASPGFVKDQFGNYMADNTCNNKNYDVIYKNLNKFIYVHASNGYKQALQEVLSKPEVLCQIKNTKACDDVNVMERYNDILGKDMERICFGFKHIQIAFEKDAIDTLLVSDDYLRKIPTYLRKELSSMMKKIKDTGGNVVKMSSMHYTGEKINSFGGITAILKYALPELNDVEEEIVNVDEMETDHHQEEIEEDDKFAMMSIKDNDFHKEDETKEEAKEDLEEDCDQEEDDQVEEIEENEEKDFKIKIKNKNGKPSKEEKKERSQIRKNQMRKKSNLDEEI